MSPGTLLFGLAVSEPLPLLGWPATPETATAMVYSPRLMEDRRQTPGMEELEKRVEELEGITDRLGTVPDEDLVETLDRAVALLREINAGIEAGIHHVGTETRELDTLLGGVDFGPFDQALEEFEERNLGGNTGESGR